jgi:hypothetical protein
MVLLAAFDEIAAGLAAGGRDGKAGALALGGRLDGEAGNFGHLR